MIRLIAILMLLAGSVGAAPVRIDPSRSEVRDGWWSLKIDLQLDAVVPYRVFTLDEPRRLVLDFEGVVWDDVTAADLLEPGRATGLRFGPLRPGWSRMVVDLAGPLAITQAAMLSADQGAMLQVMLERVSPQEFAAQSGAPIDPEGIDPVALDLPQPDPVTDGGIVVMIDPGHGGIDPGAERGGIREAEVMLDLGREVVAALNAVPGVQALLTRESDVFVPLDARITMARTAGADLMISLHADALEEDEAEGASIYTLAADGGDEASRRMVERHERGDLLAGVDLQGQGDRVARVLLDMARSETGPAGARFADALLARMRDAGVAVNNRPRREGQLAVLTAADFAGVLIEAGFLSNAADRAMLVNPEARAPLVSAIVGAVQDWAEQK